MSSAQNDAAIIGATQITLAPLGAGVFPTVIKSPSFSGGMVLVSTLGSGATVQILPIAVSGASIGGATAVGASISGYGLTAAYSWEGPAAFYLACTGATSIVTAVFKYSAGATLA